MVFDVDIISAEITHFLHFTRNIGADLLWDEKCLLQSFKFFRLTAQY